MTVPMLTSIIPASGPTSGGDLVRLSGTGFNPRVSVRFGELHAGVVALRDDAVEVRTPAHAEGAVDVVLQNLDGADAPVAGEEASLSSAYTFLRPRIAEESDLTRLVRTLLRELKRQVLANASMTVAIDYDDTTIDGANVVAISKLPSLVLSGPRVSEDRFFSTNVPHEHVGGTDIIRRRPPFTVDLAFTITAASERTVELLNLMAAVGTFLNRNRWVEIPRDPAEPGGDVVRWEMDPDGDIRTRLDGPDDVRAFTAGFVVRGFDLDEGQPLDAGRPIVDTELVTQVIELGGAA